MNCSKLPVCFVDIGIQQIHSIVHDDRINEYIHMESVSALSSLSHNTHTTCSLMLMSKQSVHMLVSLHHKNFISSTLPLSLFPSCLNMCTLICFALLCAVLRAYVHTSFSKQKHEPTIGVYGVYVYAYQYTADVYILARTHTPI